VTPGKKPPQAEVTNRSPEKTKVPLKMIYWLETQKEEGGDKTMTKADQQKS
jgi:hypothetical protein